MGKQFNQRNKINIQKLTLKKHRPIAYLIKNKTTALNKPSELRKKQCTSKMRKLFRTKMRMS